MKGKKQHHEEHVDETWLLPYSDMLTLLLALFIVMFAMSKVDTQKAKALSEQFNVIFSGGNGVVKDSGGSSPNIAPSEKNENNQAGQAEKDKGVVEQDKMLEIKSKIDQEINNNGFSDMVKTNLDAEGLDITIQDTVIFNSGEANILAQFNPVLLKISSMIKDLDNEIRISGHTDNVPIKTREYRDNWDLSYARASNVMKFMVGSGQASPDKFSILAYGEYKPKYDNSTADGRAKNRRVDILIVRKYSISGNNTK